MSSPLTEKYRPKTLDEVTGNREVLECLKSFSISNLPNMLFYGPPGTGKTTTIRALLKGHPRQNVLELNASDDRGIDVVREKIKEFASTKSQLVKMVVLDEADSMSRDAQGALRRIMEDYPNTRFCLICNFSKKIIEPIISRCTKFRFCPVNEESRIEYVCLKEDIPYDQEGISLINKYSDGDMRKVMNDMQGMRGSYDMINKKNVLEFYGLCDEKTFEDIFGTLCSAGFEQCKERISGIDIDCVGLINNVLNILMRSDIKNKMQICRELASIEVRLAEGCTDNVQMGAIIASFILNRNE